MEGVGSHLIKSFSLEVIDPSGFQNMLCAYELPEILNIYLGRMFIAFIRFLQGSLITKHLKL